MEKKNCFLYTERKTFRIQLCLNMLYVKDSTCHVVKWFEFLYLCEDLTSSHTSEEKKRPILDSVGLKEGHPYFAQTEHLPHYV